jgi:hypothetical protein
MSTPCSTLTAHPPSTPYKRQKRAPAADAYRIASQLPIRREWSGMGALPAPITRKRLLYLHEELEECKPRGRRQVDHSAV